MIRLWGCAGDIHIRVKGAAKLSLVGYAIIPQPLKIEFVQVIQASFYPQQPILFSGSYPYLDIEIHTVRLLNDCQVIASPFYNQVTNSHVMLLDNIHIREESASKLSLSTTTR